MRQQHRNPHSITGTMNKLLAEAVRMGRNIFSLQLRMNAQSSDKEEILRLFRERLHESRLFDQDHQDPGFLLNQAITFGQVDALKLLLENGVDPNMDYQGKSALCIAASEEAEVAGDYLSPPSIISDDGNKGTSEMCKLLIQYGANVNATKNHQSRTTPAHEIACLRDISLLKLLYESGADMSALDHNGNTPLAVATLNHFPDAVRFLLDVGAGDSNTQCSMTDGSTGRGDTLLHCAVLVSGNDAAPCSTVHVGARNVIQVLLSKGADPTLTNNSGQTALNVACDRGSLDSIFMIVQYGVGNGTITPMETIRE